MNMVSNILVYLLCTLSPYSFSSYPVSVAPGRGWREVLVRTQKLYANQNQGGLISQLGGAEKAVSDHIDSRDLK